MSITKIKSQLITTDQLFGRIYLATNSLNGKVYIGKTEFPRTIRKRWIEHYAEARKFKRLRERNPDKKFWGSHLNNALLKYKRSVWKLIELDIAYSEDELNRKEKFWIKKYDSMNPKNGYNMREGGEGGKPSEDVRKKISEAVKKKYREDPKYRERMRFLSKERMKDPEYKAKYLKRLNEGLKKKKQDPEFREKMRKFVIELNKRKAKSPEFIQNLKEAHKHERKEIPNVKQCLKEIKAGKECSELAKQYNMSRPTLNRRIRELLGKFDVKHYTDACKFLKDMDIDKLLLKLPPFS